VALVSILNSLKCLVTPDFLSIDQFLHQLSTFYEKLKKICVVEVWFFFQLFCPRIIESGYYFSCTVLAKSHLACSRRSDSGARAKTKASSSLTDQRMTVVQIIYLTDPLEWNLTEIVGPQQIIFNIFQLTTTVAMSSYEDRFVLKIKVVFYALYFENEASEPPMFLHFWHT